MTNPCSDPTTTTTGSYRWWLVGMLWLVCLLNYADRQAIYSVFDLLREEMHLNDVQLGFVGNSFMWVYAAALPLAGLVGDRWSRKLLILGGLTFWSIVTLLTALSRRYEHLLLFRALEGLGEAFYMPASLSLISDYHGPETRSRAMGLHQSSVYAGTVLGGTVAGWCAEHYGWRYGFYLFGSVGVVLAVVLLFFLREPPRRRKMENHAMDDSVFRAAADVFRIPMVLLLMAVFVGANFVAAIFLTWLPTYLKRHFGMSLTFSGLNATLWPQAASVVGVLIGGWLADRWTRRRRGGRMLVQAIGLFAGAPLIFLTGWTLSVPILVVALSGFGLFKGFYDANIWAALYDFVPKPRRATAVGFMNAIGWLGGSTAPVLFPLAAARFSMSGALSATSLIYVLFGTLLLGGITTLASGGRQPPVGNEKTGS
ncbi:MAG TPA: MFS transporter [Gemmataceae bacterium]|jgi:MFS family permease